MWVLNRRDLKFWLCWRRKRSVNPSKSYRPQPIIQTCEIRLRFCLKSFHLSNIRLIYSYQNNIRQHVAQSVNVLFDVCSHRVDIRPPPPPAPSSKQQQKSKFHQNNNGPQGKKKDFGILMLYYAYKSTFQHSLYIQYVYPLDILLSPTQRFTTSTFP